MNLNKWIRTKIYRSLDAKKVREVEEASGEVSKEAQRLRRRVAQPEAAEVLARVPVRNGNGHT